MWTLVLTGDVVDEHVASEVQMHDGRELCPPAALETMGFELKEWPTSCTNFRDDVQVVYVAYHRTDASAKHDDHSSERALICVGGRHVLCRDDGSRQGGVGCAASLHLRPNGP